MTARHACRCRTVAPAESPAPVPDAYLGAWRRSLLETAAGRDERSLVVWLQTPRWHADLRLPADRPDFSDIDRLADCDDGQLSWLARQQGFCGITQVEGARCRWQRLMDFQPASGSRDIGHMAFDGERVIETGVESDYLEIWERLPQSRGGSAALELVVERGALPARPAWLLVAGDCFMFVRDRMHRLPDAADLPQLIARTRPSRVLLLDWLNVEISFGHRTGSTPWRIEHSTLPWREGRTLALPGAIQRRSHQVAVEGCNERRWRVLDWSLDAAL